MSKFRRTVVGSVAAAALVASVAAAAPASASVTHRADENEGTTTVVLNPAVVGTLVSLGVAPVAPGTLTAPGGVYQLAFPITNDPTKGLVYHAGGLDFANASGHDVRITRFIVNTNTGFLTAAAKVDGKWVGRIRVFKLGAGRRQEHWACPRRGDCSSEMLASCPAQRADRLTPGGQGPEPRPLPASPADHLAMGDAHW